MHGIDIQLPPQESVGVVALAGAYTGDHIERKLQERQAERNLDKTAELVSFAASSLAADGKQPKAKAIASRAQFLITSRHAAALPANDFRNQITALYTQITDISKTLPLEKQIIWEELVVSHMRQESSPEEHPRRTSIRSD
jgi:hypothetical protein